tara:strand:+ start:181 stop:723 length:543 start_codon:yes stop_codon:yes gene_type:complete
MIWTKENFLSEKECQDIINSNDHRAEPVNYSEYIDSDGSVQSTYDVKGRDRKSDICYFHDMSIRNNINHYLSVKLNVDFHSIDKYEAFHFIKYNQLDHFNWHNDVTRMGEYYTALITLNDSYEGGKLLYRDINRNIQQFITKTGTLYLFPAKIFHAVQKITEGTRYSLATWFFNKNKTAI